MFALDFVMTACNAQLSNLLKIEGQALGSSSVFPSFPWRLNPQPWDAPPPPFPTVPRALALGSPSTFSTSLGVAAEKRGVGAAGMAWALDHTRASPLQFWACTRYGLCVSLLLGQKWRLKDQVGLASPEA